MLAQQDNLWVIVGGMFVALAVSLLLLLAALGGFQLALIVLVFPALALTGFAGSYLWSLMEKHRAASGMKQHTGLTVGPRSDWFPRAILAGFIASSAMLFAFLIAYGIAYLYSYAVGAPISDISRLKVATWVYNLVHNPLTDIAQSSLYFSMGAHLFVGMTLAVIYAYFFEPRMDMPHFEQGVLYSAVPWLFSVLVFFPLVGGGLLGINLGAGPFPFLGNLILHLVYGATLGLMYGPLGDTLPGAEVEAASAENQEAMRSSEQAAAKGIVAGLLGGLIIGTVQAAASSTALPNAGLGTVPLSASILGLTFLGGAVGALLGSIVGLPTSSHLAHR